MEEAREFHCYSHVFENIGEKIHTERSCICSVIVHRQTLRGHQGKRIPSWMFKHPVFYSILRRLDDDHQDPDDPIAALADFKKLCSRKHRKRTICFYARHQAAWEPCFLPPPTHYEPQETRILTHLFFCEAWEPAKKCIVRNSFECIYFQRLSQIIASLKREILCRKMDTFSWTQTELEYRSCVMQTWVFVPGAPRDKCSAFALFPMKTVILWKTKNRARSCVKIGVRFSKCAMGSEENHCYETILRSVQKEPDYTR